MNENKRGIFNDRRQGAFNSGGSLVAECTATLTFKTESIIPIVNY